MAHPFLCVGQMKAGTTWLSYLFASSHDYFIPPVKEWQYLNFLSQHGEATATALMTDPRYAQFRDNIFRFALDTFLLQRDAIVGKAISPGLWQCLEWWRLYLFADRNIETFARLIRDPAGPPSFDICPQYLLLDEETIRSAKRAVPGLRIVLMLRDPLSRCVSNLTMFGASGNLVHATEAGWVHVRDHGGAAAAIERYAACFSADRIFIGFLDDVRAQPIAFARKLAAFLDARAPEQIPAPANVGDASIRPWAHAALISESLEEIEQLRAWVDGPMIDRWERRVRRGVLDSEDASAEPHSTEPCSGPLSQFIPRLQRTEIRKAKGLAAVHGLGAR
jgi:hypothetical protein